MRSRPEPNSRMQARPPGVRTLSISRKASSLGRMLRMPKAMVMLSTEQSGRGSFLASAVTVVMRFFAPGSDFLPAVDQHGLAEIHSQDVEAGGDGA